MILNRGDSELRAALNGLLGDPQPEVRKAVVKALGELQEKQSVPAIVTALNDNDPSVQAEVFSALQKIPQHVSDEDWAKLAVRAEVIAAANLSGPLHTGALEVLETAGEKSIAQADQLQLQGKAPQAEALLLDALKKVPDSKNLNFRLGRFYFDNEQQAKGIEILEKNGFVLRIKKLSPLPTIDGDLSDECWKSAPLINKFYQCLNTYLIKPGEGKADIKVGYSDDAIYIAYKAFETSTAGIRRNVKNRDADVYLDDCTEIFFDTEHGYKKFYQVIINSLGTVEDILREGRNSMDNKWNANVEVKTKVEPTFWTLEAKIPVADMKAIAKPGTIWGFNITTTRCGNLSEQGQWVPTYGASARPDKFGFLIFE
jgi:tetratricopeptide (TPR) repeat protein